MPFLIEPMAGSLLPLSETKFLFSYSPSSLATSRGLLGPGNDALAFLEVLDVPHRNSQSSLPPKTIQRSSQQMSENVLTGDWIAVPTPRTQTPMTNVSNVQASLVTTDRVSIEQSEEKLGGFLAKSPLDGEKNDATLSPSSLLNHSSSENHPSDYDLINVLSKEGIDSVKRTSVIVARVSMQGSVNPTSSMVSAFPSVVILPGPLFPGQVAAQTITLTNNGDVPLDFKFVKVKISVSSSSSVCESSSDSHALFAIHPPIGSISPHGTVTLSLTLNVNIPGRYECDLECQYFLQPFSTAVNELSSAIIAASAAGEKDAISQRFNMSAGSLLIRASGTAKCPEVRFSEPIVDMGLLGCERTEKLTHGVRIINTSDAYCRWHLSRVRGPGSPAFDTLPKGTSSPRADANISTFSIMESETDGNDAGIDLELQPPDMKGVFSNIWFSPSIGVLPPFGHIDVLVSVDTGSRPERLRAFLRVVVEPFDENESEESSLIVAARKTEEARQLAFDKLNQIEAAGGLLEGKENELAVPEIVKPRMWKGVSQELRSPPAYMRLVGEVQAPRLSLSTHKLILGVVFLGVPVKTSFKVTNLCNLSVDFKLDGYVGCKAPPSNGMSFSTSSESSAISSEAKSKAALGLLMGGGGLSKKKALQGPPVSKFDVSFEHLPARDGSGGGVGSGRLGPKQEIEVFVTFTPRFEGVIKDHFIACDVIGMQHPLGINVEALARGLTLAYSLVDDATGFVIPLPRRSVPSSALSVATEKSITKKSLSLLSLETEPQEVLDMDAAFKKSMDDIDASLLKDPAVLQIIDAIALAEKYGASIGRIPDLLFSKPHPNLHPPTMEQIFDAVPLELLQRRSFTLHVLNLSGIPTHLRAKVQKFSAFEVLQNGSDTNWPALYAAAEAIEVSTLSDPTGVRKVKEMHTSTTGHTPFSSHSHIKVSDLSDELFSMGASGIHSAPTTNTSTIPFNGKGLSESSLVTKSSEGHEIDLSQRKSTVMESQKIKRIAGVHKFGLQPASFSTSNNIRRASDYNDSQSPSDNQDGTSFSFTLGNTIASGTAGKVSTSFSGTSKVGKDRSSSPPKRPKSFLSNNVELSATYQSKGGRLHLAMNECKKLMRQSLGVQAVLDAEAAAAAPSMTSRSQRAYFGELELKGASFEIFPKQCDLPPFGHLAISIAGLADLPGTYEDVLDLSVFVPIGASSSSNSTSTITSIQNNVVGAPLPFGFISEPKLSTAVPIKALIAGNMLSLNNRTVGLQLDGASGTTAPTLNFGDQGINSPDLEKAIIIENNGPLDAHLVFHTMRDRCTMSQTSATSIPVLAVDLVEHLEEDGKIDDHNEDQDVRTVGVVIRPMNDRVDIVDDEKSSSKPSPIPFNISPSSVIVPAYGSASVKVTGRSEKVTEADLRLAKELGWPEELRSFSRAKFSADAVFVARGSQPPSSFLARAKAPYTPIEPSFGEGKGFNKFDDIGIDSLSSFPTTSTLSIHLQPQFLRDALTVHAVLRPFVPLLTIEGAVTLGDTRPWISLHVSSLAVEKVLQVASTAVKAPEISTLQPPLSCTKSFSLSNASGSDLTFVLKIDGPFQIISANTAAPPHPVTRVDVLASRKPPSKSGFIALPSDASVNDSLISLFAPGLMKKAIIENGGKIPKIYSLPPKCNMTIHVAFDPIVGKKMIPSLANLTSAQLFLNKTNSNKVKEDGEKDFLVESNTDSNAFTSTVIVSEDPADDAVNVSIGKPSARKIRAKTLIAKGQEGTVTLSSTGSVSAIDSFSPPATTSTLTSMGQTLAPAQTDGVDAVIAASITRLRGEHLGLLSVTFANGTVQEVGLRCEVLRPAIIATPSSHSFGTIRILPSGKKPGEGTSEESQSLFSLQVSNPTTVDAHWSLKHIPAPSPKQARPGEVVDWQSLGLLPGNALWATKPPSDLLSALDDPSAFAFSSVSGVLMGPTAPLELSEGKGLRASDGLPQPMTLMVVFRPKEAKLYQSRFRICVKEGESFEILLRGRGSLEEKDNAVRF
jgi:hypothetical protein